MLQSIFQYITTIPTHHTCLQYELVMLVTAALTVLSQLLKSGQVLISSTLLYSFLIREESIINLALMPSSYQGLRRAFILQRL